MRRILQSVLDLFKELRELQSELEPEMQECLRSFYALGRKKSLCARSRKRPSGLIRQIYLIARCRKAEKQVGLRRIRLCHHIQGRINEGLIREVAVDLSHKTEWYQADQVRVELNQRSALYASALRILRLAFSNKFGARATLADRGNVQKLLEIHPILIHDAPGILGAVVYDRLLQDLEHRICALVLRWKGAMHIVPFEPLVRWRDSGPLRLTWAYVERFHDLEGNHQVRSTDIRGGVTDLWLRKNYSTAGSGRRKEILSYAVPLRKLTREYSRLLVYVGRLKSRVRRALLEDTSSARPAAGAEAM